MLVSHCFPLTGRPDPFAAISGQTLGELGVSIFFAISGFLIAKSWSDSRAVAPFVLKRGLRLLPALVMAVLLTALVLGPLVTTLAPLKYFTSAEVYRYIAENSALFTINGRLPGVFVHNVYPSAVNGSLWTLPVEAIAYVGAAILGAVGALRGRVGLACVNFLALLALSMPMVGVSSLQLGGAAGGNLADVVYLGGLFNCGMLLYALRDRIALRWDVFVLFAISWIASYDTAWVRPVAIVVIPYLVLVLAYRTPAAVRVITRPGDVSYWDLRLRVPDATAGSLRLGNRPHTGHHAGFGRCTGVPTRTCILATRRGASPRPEAAVLDEVRSHPALA